MINWIKIENYKGFASLRLENITRITLIGGRNNVGKTALLESIFLFNDTADPGMFFRHLSWRGIGVTSGNAETVLAPIFRDFNMESPITIEVSDSIYTGKMEMRFNPSHVQKTIDVDFNSPGDTFPTVKTDQIASTSYALDIQYEVSGGGKQDISLVVTQSPTNLNIKFEPGPIMAPPGMTHPVIFLPMRLKVDPAEEANRFAQLDIEKRSDRVIEFLRVIEPNLIGLSVVSLPFQKAEVYADIGMSHKIPVAYMGDGMSRLLSLILAIAAAKNGIVLIDEIDAGIHHSIMVKVWEELCRAAKEFNCQIFATTHSYECLQAAYEGCGQAGLPHDFRYIRLDRQDKEIVAKPYSYEVLGAALDRGWEVR
jgi:AAA15 family ATPase/GTPase